MLTYRDISELVTDYLSMGASAVTMGGQLHSRLCEACHRYTDQTAK